MVDDGDRGFRGAVPPPPSPPRLPPIPPPPPALGLPTSPAVNVDRGEADDTIDPDRRTRRRRLALIIGGAAAALVLAVGVGAFLTLNSATPSATDLPAAAPSEASGAVEAYLDALVAGDASAAIELLPVDTGSASAVLLDDEIYASGAHPSGYTITGSSDDGDVSLISASLDLGGQAYPAEFTVERSGDESGENGGWILTSGPIATVVVGDIRAVRAVNAVDVDLSGIAPGTTLVALPGRYVFSAPADDQLVTYGEDQVIDVGPDGAASPNSIEFVPSLSEAGRSSAIDAVRARVEHCMLSDAFRPNDCPRILEMEDPGSYAITGITRSWMQTPDYSIIESDDTRTGYAVLVSGGEMHIDFAWRYAEGDPWQPDDVVMSDVFGQTDSRGTVVGIAIDPTTGLGLDFSAF